MRGKKRKWDDAHHSDDPASGLLNLFDVWIAFAAALLLASVSYGQLSTRQKQTPGADAKTTSQDLEAIKKQRQQVDHYRVSQQRAGGDGERLGIAYRLKTGEVIYVPETK